MSREKSEDEKSGERLAKVIPIRAAKPFQMSVRLEGDRIIVRMPDGSEKSAPVGKRTDQIGPR
jgi:hypothetical protein